MVDVSSSQAFEINWKETHKSYLKDSEAKDKKKNEENKINPFEINWGSTTSAEDAKKAEAEGKRTEPYNSNRISWGGLDTFDKSEKPADKKTAGQNTQTANANSINNSFSGFSAQNKATAATAADSPEAKEAYKPSGKSFGNVMQNVKSSKGKKTSGASFRGIRLDSSIWDYKSDAQKEKNWSDAKLKLHKKEQKTTQTEQKKRKSSPTGADISPTAGEIDQSINTTKGASVAVNTSQKADTGVLNIQAAPVSTGAASGLGSLNGSVSDIDKEFKDTSKSNGNNESDKYQEVVSGVSSSRGQEDNGLQAFTSSKSSAVSAEGTLRTESTAAQSSNQEAQSANNDKTTASNGISNANSTIESGQSNVTQGNSMVESGVSKYGSATDIAQAALKLRDEAAKLQKDGLKNLDTAMKKMNQGVKETKQGDGQIGQGLGLITAGIPLALGLFTMPIGVAMIIAGNTLVDNGHNNVEKGIKSVATGKKERENGMKTFDKGTETAQASKEKQEEADGTNSEAKNINSQGQSLIASGKESTQKGESRKTAETAKFDSSSSKEKTSQNIAQSHTKNAENASSSVNAMVAAANKALGEALTAKTMAESLTGLKGTGVYQAGSAKAQGGAGMIPVSTASNSGGLGAAGGLNDESTPFNMSGAFKAKMPAKKGKGVQKPQTVAKNNTKQQNRQQNPNTSIFAANNNQKLKDENPGFRVA